MLLLALVAFRIIHLQIRDGKKYKDIAYNITEKIDTIYANKGNVYAADGSLLATSMFRYEIRMDVPVVYHNIEEGIISDDISELSDKLDRFFNKAKGTYYSKIQKAKAKGDRYLFIAKNLNYTDYQTLKSFPVFKKGANKGGFITIQSTVREHPLGKIAERTIGYDDYRGRPGIEGAYATELTGRNGVRLKQKIAKGQWKPINDNNEIEPQDGKDIITTIDVNMQDIVHHALLQQLVTYNAQHGTAVLMEVATGEVKAIVNLGKSEEGTYYEDRNYAVYESYEPGSTFKIASMLVALEDKVIDTSSVVDTTGKKWRISGRDVVDSGHTDYGVISAARAIEISSNVGVAKLIYEHYKNNPKKFVDGIREIGLDKTLNVPIKGEGKPFFPEPGSKNWSGTSLPWMSFGYGIHLTPLQVLTFYNAIANHGVMVRPKFVKEVSYQNNTKGAIVYPTEIINPNIASAETLNKLKAMMLGVVKHGTATNIYSPDYSLAGKTGTSQANYWTANKSYISSFAGFFPYENPKYSCVVVVHIPEQLEYYGSKVAGPVFQKIAHKIYAATPNINRVRNGEPILPRINSSYSQYKYQNSKQVPNVVGLPAMDAVAVLENKGLKVQLQGNGKVTNQSIPAGNEIVKGSQIYLSTN